MHWRHFAVVDGDELLGMIRVHVYKEQRVVGAPQDQRNVFIVDEN